MKATCAHCQTINDFDHTEEVDKEYVVCYSCGKSFAVAPVSGVESKEIAKAVMFMEWAKDSDLFYEFEIMYRKISPDSQNKNK